MDKDRLVHSLAVARKCFKIALEQGLSEENVKSRYGENSEIYRKCCQLVDEIR